MKSVGISTPEMAQARSGRRPITRGSTGTGYTSMAPETTVAPQHCSKSAAAMDETSGQRVRSTWRS